MNTKHTPGPWDAYITPHGLEIYETDGSGNGDHIDVNGDSPTSHANARLIAAAPELLHELRKCVSRLNDCIEQLHADAAHLRMSAHGRILFRLADLCIDDVKFARAAIAKAEGK